MQSERGRITAALNADQLIGRDYSKLSLGVRSRYKTVSDSEALLCDAEPLVRHISHLKAMLEQWRGYKLHWSSGKIASCAVGIGGCANCESGECSLQEVFAKVQHNKQLLKATWQRRQGVRVFFNRAF